MHLPSLPNIRIDSGSIELESLNPDFDPLVKKVISWGINREESNKSLIEFMKSYALFGVSTNQEFLMRILQHHDFKTCNYSTNFFRKNESYILEKLTETKQELSIIGISYLLLKESHTTNINNIWNSTGYWRQYNNYKITIDDTTLSVQKIYESSDTKTIKIDGENINYTIESIQHATNSLTFWIENKEYHVYYFFDTKGLCIQFNGKKRFIKDYLPSTKKKQEIKENNSKELKAPIPGKILDIMVRNGDIIKKGEPLIILEAMKIENHLKAWKTTKIKNITVQKGQQVSFDDILLETE